jgi:hypothetical protein
VAEGSEQPAKKPTCFVLMPISDTVGYEPGHFGRVYEHLLKPAIVAAGYIPVRADDAVKTDYIVVGIIQKIVESEMVVCDISARNPNVMYELGVRHAFNKPVVLVKDKRTEKIFDIQGLRYAEYDESLRIDAVTKDTLKITSAIGETANATAQDTNSIVHLAGIKTAEVPASQTISADTQLILSALNSLERRVDDIQGISEAAPSDYYVTRDSFVTPRESFRIGSEMFKNGNFLGKVVELNDRAQAVRVETPTGIVKWVPANSDMLQGVDDIPF